MKYSDIECIIESMPIKPILIEFLTKMITSRYFQQEKCLVLQKAFLAKSGTISNGSVTLASQTFAHQTFERQLINVVKFKFFIKKSQFLTNSIFINLSNFFVVVYFSNVCVS